VTDSLLLTVDPDDLACTDLDREPAPRVELPDPYRCDDPWCRSAGQGPHLHGTRPDGRRV